MALPFMVAGEHCEEPLAPVLRAVVGGMAGPEGWAELLAAGSRTAAEFRDAWDSLAGEAADIFAYLAEVPTGPLAAPLERVGGNSVDGST